MEGQWTLLVMYQLNTSSQPPHPFDPPTGSPLPLNHVVVTASFGRILPAALLRRFDTSRRLNVHPSLLPLYRGPAPIQHALMNGRSETGVCVIEMMERSKGIDAGPIWGSSKTVVFPVIRPQLRSLTSFPYSQYHKTLTSFRCEIL